MTTLSRLLTVVLLTHCLLKGQTIQAAQDGVYLPVEDGAVTLTLWDGQHVHAKWLKQLPHRNARLRSVDNDNEVYQLDIELPFSEGDSRHRYLVADGVAVSVTYSDKVDQRNDKDLWHHWYNQIRVDAGQDDALLALAAGLKATQIDREDPGHVLRAVWQPTAKSFHIGESVVLRMTLTNTGEQPVNFYDGGMQRGPRNNQFDFICRHNSGVALPDVGNPLNFGGISQKVSLQHNESLTKDVDITNWFQFEEQGTYRVTGLFRLELQPAEDEWRVLWDDIAVGECKVQINPAVAAATDEESESADHGQSTVAADGNPTKQRSTEMQTSRLPVNDELAVGQIELRDDGLQQNVPVRSVVVKLHNRTSYAVDIEFDPRNLQIELVDADGKPVETEAEKRSGPVPISHKVTISCDTYAGIPTHRGGIGLPVGGTLLAAGWQSWNLAPGKYSMTGTVKVAADFGKAVLDPNRTRLLHRESKPELFAQAEKNDLVEILLPRIQFEIP